MDTPFPFEILPIAGPADLPELTAVMTRAFDDDARRHLGQERGGPPGYDNGDFFRQWLFGQQYTRGYKAVSAGKIVAAMIAWILPDHRNFVGTIFVDPAWQRRGIGTRMLRFLDEIYPETISWTLETPSWAVSNHRFYESCGFQRVKEENDSVTFRRVRLEQA